LPVLEPTDTDPLAADCVPKPHLLVFPVAAVVAAVNPATVPSSFVAAAIEAASVKF